MKNIFTSIIVIGSLSVNAQLSEIDIHAGVAFPQNEFKDNFQGEIYGIGTSVLFSKSPTSFIEYGFGLNYGKTNSMEDDVLILVNDYNTTGKLEVKSAEFNTNLKARLIPYKGTIQPFLELNTGANTYFTNSEIKTNIGYYDRDEQLVSKTISTSKDGMIDGMNFYAGWSAGAKFKLSENLLIKADVSRTYTTQGRYLDASSVDISNKGFVSYDLKQSNTSQIKTSLGLVYQF